MAAPNSAGIARGSADLRLLCHRRSASSLRGAFGHELFERASRSRDCWACIAGDNFGPPFLSGFVVPDQGFGDCDNVLRSEAQLTHHDLTGCGRTEAIQPDDCTVEADVALPSERGTCLDADSRLDAGRKNRVPVGLRLRLKQIS